MRAHRHAAPLVVVRSEAESGRVGLRLIGELDLNTVDLLERELAGSREQSPPAVIDLSELRFLDLIGLRALLRAGDMDGIPATRLVGATGIVRRLIDLTRVLDAESDVATAAPFAGELTRAVSYVATNGNGRASNGNNFSNGNGNRRAATSRNGDAP